MLTERFDAALLLAAKLHREQYRKGTTIPYLGHLLAVAGLVIDDGGSEDEAIAALLHDSIEDQGRNFHGGREALRAHIREQFGSEVAAIVDACTDDEGFTKRAAATPEEERTLYLKRKQKYVESIEDKTPEALRVTTADKVHNAESILDAYAKVGPEVWNRFRTKSRNDTIDNYRNLSNALTKQNERFEPDRRGLPDRLSRAVDLLETGLVP
jgi:(p)ppGpp synthase/HD superfamily hydrolase